MNEGLNVFGGFAGLGVLIASVAFSWAQFRSGGSKAKDDLIGTLKESLEVEKEKVKTITDEKNTLVNSHQNQINSLTEKIGKLQGLYEAAEQRSKEYLSILQGRDPEQKQFMTLVTNTIAEGAKSSAAAQKYMNDTAMILNEIKTFMSMMNSEIAKGNVFNREIEEATKSGTGKPLMKKV